MRKLLTTMMLLSAGLMVGSDAFAGLQLGATRIIYPADEKSVSVSVMNTGGDLPYLVQSAVSARTDGGDAPFFVSPPLFRLEPGAQNQVRITRLAKELPADRESLFWFSVRGLAAARSAPNAATPSASDFSAAQASLSASVGLFVKLIYRPRGLAGKWSEGMSGLKVSRNASGIHLTNGSPYYINFSSLSIGGRKVLDQQADVQKTTLAPFSDADLPVGSVSPGAPVEWRVINDYGTVETFKGDVS
ncbi:fimbrial biogenesis chaperone [Enterobacter ludwigii]|uniref:fimbrial biogenesis chaperone n=1 Tax=Enterobacter ludwigii TaxID=299767 RepID=UPI0018661E83|nr:molecular chaperone [Enterobacter ludwigii]